jgi:hypothetical protein
MALYEHLPTRKANFDLQIYLDGILQESIGLNRKSTGCNHPFINIKVPRGKLPKQREDVTLALSSPQTQGSSGMGSIPAALRLWKGAILGVDSFKHIQAIAILPETELQNGYQKMAFSSFVFGAVHLAFLSRVPAFLVGLQ